MWGFCCGDRVRFRDRTGKIIGFDDFNFALVQWDHVQRDEHTCDFVHQSVLSAE